MTAAMNAANERANEIFRQEVISVSLHFDGFVAQRQGETGGRCEVFRVSLVDTLLCDFVISVCPLVQI